MFIGEAVDVEKEPVFVNAPVMFGNIYVFFEIRDLFFLGY